jgi:hypothetical protein
MTDVPEETVVGLAQWLAVPGQPDLNEATAARAVRELASRGPASWSYPNCGCADTTRVPWPPTPGPRPNRWTAAAGECSYVVYRLPLRESLRQARAESGPLLSGRRPELYGPAW